MKIHSEANSPAFFVEFEPVVHYNVHEASIAVSALAHHNSLQFRQGTGRGEDPRQRLAELTQPMAHTGAYQFVAYMQIAMREKAREGVLSDPIRTKLKEELLDILHISLNGFYDDTEPCVVGEMPNSMGNFSGLTRTLEAFAAADMIGEIRNSGAAIEPITPSRRPPFGYGRILHEFDT